MAERSLSSDSQAGWASPGGSVLPGSSLYAYAALEGGDAYVNFTPSPGSRIPALLELAEARGGVHGGADGKTGETLVKSVLGELFARRNLTVLSWFGQNILGNEDGRVLNDPRDRLQAIVESGAVLNLSTLLTTVNAVV